MHALAGERGRCQALLLLVGMAPGRCLLVLLWLLQPQPVLGEGACLGPERRLRMQAARLVGRSQGQRGCSMVDLVNYAVCQ